MKTSLIISTYNRPDALCLCLLSALSQTRLPDEIVIGDDGSTAETKILIDKFKKTSPVTIKHIWHEDKGFRLAMMRNKCVAASSGDYIIEVDGDVILERHFIEDHLGFARPGFYLKGGRTNLGKQLTNSLCHRLRLKNIRFYTRGIESKPENSLRIPWLGRMLAANYRKRRGMCLGCNMSYYRQDFLDINGYDEFFEGWGGEDGDLTRRLIQNGIKKRHLKFVGLVYHLWHTDKFMYNKETNVSYSMREAPKTYCDNGVSKYLIR